MNSRFEYLSQMKDGWCDGEGKAPSREAITKAKEYLENLNSKYELPKPGVFPTFEGGIQLEWYIKLWAIEVTFDQLGKLVSATALNVFNTEEFAFNDDFIKERLEIK